MKRFFATVALAAAVVLAGRFPLLSQTRLEPYLELELKRVEETYRLMDKYAQTIWPGWNNYMEIEFQVQYPNLVFLLIGPRFDNVPDGYELVPDRTFRGKKIYINRKEELPVKIQPPLSGGGGGGLTIRIHLRDGEVTQEQADKAIADNLVKKDPAFEPMASSDREILLYVHEFFHGYQMRAMKSRKEMTARREAAEKARAELARLEKTDPEKARAEKAKAEKSGQPGKAANRPVMDDRDREGQGFEANTEYSTYSSIEAMALLNAYDEKDKAKALESLKDYSVARGIKHSKYMPAEDAEEEAATTLSEGTAVYSNTKMAMLIRDKKYKPAMGPKDDPFFYNFSYMTQNIYSNTKGSILGLQKSTLDTLGKCYTYGVYQCLLLDRFFPGWKKGFFEGGQTLDQVLASKLKITDGEKAVVAERLKAKYGYDKLYAEHAAVINDRDEIRNIVKSRKGRTYIVDFQKTREFLSPQGRENGRDVTVGVSGYFVNGIEDYVFGDVVMTTWNTPIHKPFLYTLEWTDTEVKPDEKNYTFYYGKKDGDVYKDVFFTTPGFTLKAPEVTIKEDKEKNLFRIYIMRKVAG